LCRATATEIASPTMARDSAALCCHCSSGLQPASAAGFALYRGTLRNSRLDVATASWRVTDGRGLRVSYVTICSQEFGGSPLPHLQSRRSSSRPLCAKSHQDWKDTSQWLSAVHNGNGFCFWPSRRRRVRRLSAGSQRRRRSLPKPPLLLVLRFRGPPKLPRSPWARSTC